jgi:DNA-binding beta-propeller fold protein YncE
MMLPIVVVCAPASSIQAQPGHGATGTLVVSNMNDNTATIVDLASSRVLATLPTGEGPHEVAASRDGRWAVVSNYGVRGKPGNSLTLIDVKKLSVARTIDLKEYQQPHGAKFLPGDTTVVVTAQGAKLLLFVDVRSGAVVKTMPTNGRVSHMLGVSANGDRIVTGNIPDGMMSLIDVKAGGEPKIIPVARQPEGIAITPDGSFSWVGSNRDSVVLIVNNDTGVAVDTLRGFGLPYRLAVSPDGKRAVVTDPVNANVRIFDVATHKQQRSVEIPRDSLVATAEVPGSPSPEGVTISPDSKWAFVTLQGRNRVITIDLARGTIVAWAVTGTWSDGIAYSPLLHPR